MKVKDISADDSDAHRLSEQRIELAKDEYYEHEWEDLDGIDSVVALIETLKGDAAIEFQGPPGPDLSKVARVRLYAGKLTSNIRKVAVRIRAATATTLRVTVAFVKREALQGWKRVSCKACKTLIRLGINALLTSAGIAPLDIDIPLKEYLPLDQAQTWLAGVAHSLGVGIPEGLTQVFSALGPQFWPALKGTLDVLTWVTESVDRVLEAGCRVVGCCTEKKA
jgi:hypothetical protein